MNRLVVFFHTFAFFPYPIVYTMATQEPSVNVRKILWASYGVFVAMAYMWLHSLFLSLFLAYGCLEIAFRIFLAFCVVNP